MTALQQALLKARVVDQDAIDWATGRDGAPKRAQAPSMEVARRRWLEGARAELLADPTSETARRLIRDVHERYDDGSDEFRRFLRPFYTLRDQLDRTARAAREQLIRRTL
ncbi:MAG: hypothetical protein Q8R16_02005 [bacterium]|nr:hypothetical protein [bacterium]